MVIFSIWWAWNHFTWLASAYDTDDVPYRLFTILQMGGIFVHVLVQLVAMVVHVRRDRTFLGGYSLRGLIQCGVPNESRN